MTAAVSSPEINAWQSSADELAQWTLARLAIKTDRFGRYNPMGGARWGFEPLSDTVLRAHFFGRQTIGLGGISPADECLWIAVDVDNHETDVGTSVNLQYALVLRERLRTWGFRPIIEDSDGKGGVHVWVFLTTPIPAAVAYRFSRWLVRDFQAHGLRKIETFPKSPSVKSTEKECGHYLRVFGRHHKRPHWSRIYGEDDWLSIEQSVAAILSHQGDAPQLIPEVPEEKCPPVRPSRFIAHGTSGDRDEILARDALGVLDPDCHYDDWIKIGQALHSSGDHMFGLWMEWSAGSKDFDEDECRSKWTTFHRGSPGVTLGTLFYLAGEHGWQRPASKYVRSEEPPQLLTDEETGEVVLQEPMPPNAVELILDEMSVNNSVIDILAKSHDLFDFHGQLAVIHHREDEEGIPEASIHVLSLPGMRELISKHCLFFVWKENGETGEDIPAWHRVPRWVYEGVMVRGLWSGIRPLRAVVNCPVLRPDGSVVQTAGYDRASSLFVSLRESFPPVPEHPTQEQILAAAELLRNVVCDFPFKTEAHLASWVAAVLTPIAREAYHGPTSPLFLMDANVRGSGKSLLGDLISLIVEGREATRFTAPQNDEESRKRITALVEHNDRVILIDNIVGSFGCASLDAALTGSVWEDRRLGHSAMIEAPLRMTWLASGNNVILAADTARRVCHIRLESPLENPEDREGFRHPDIRKHVRQNRPALLTAALTILRGFIAAGRPDQKLKAWGSFEGWSDLVRQAVVFAGFDDPGTTREELRATSDSEAGALQRMLETVSSMDVSRKGFSAGEMIQIASGQTSSYSREEIESLREAIQQFCDGTLDRINSRRLGSRMKHFRNRVCGGMAFDFVTRGGNRYWFAQVAGDSGGSGGSATPDLSATENQMFSAPSSHKTPIRDAADVSHLSHLSHHDEYDWMTFPPHSQTPPGT